MARRISGAVVVLALLAGGTSAAQTSKTGGAPKGGASAATSAGAVTSGAASASGAPVASGAPSASAPVGSGPPVASQAPASSAGAPALSAAEESAKAFQAGREAFKADQFERALLLFKQSFALEASAGVLLNIALTEEKLGRPATALRDFERVIELLAADDDRLPIAKEGRGRVKLRAPHLKIERAAGAPPTLAIKVDGEPLAANLVGVEQALDPGKHVITTSVFGFEDRPYEVTLTEGQHLPIAVEPGKRTLVAAPVTTSAAPDASAPNGGRLAAFALTGAGLAGLGVGIATGVMTLSKKDELAAACPDPKACGPAGQRALGEAHTLADLSTGTLIFGGIATAAGVVMLFTIGGGKSLFVSASASPSAGGITASGRF